MGGFILTTDFLIIGAGVMGAALARVLSRYEGTVTVLDRGCDVAEGASKANSAIVHAGYDAVPGTNKARFNVEGAQMYPGLSKELGVPYGQPGAMVLAFSEEDRATLEKLLAQGIANGVPQLRIIEHDEILRIEPNTNPAVVCALHVPTSGLTSPYEMTYALADHAAMNGVTFHLNTLVTGLKREGELWTVETDKGSFTCRVLINCAGGRADVLHNQISDTKLQIVHRRGQYYLLDHLKPMPFWSTMFQCPTKMGKGILVSPTVHGNILLGPTAEDIDDDLDTSTTAEGLAVALEKARLTWPNVSTRGTITNFSGIRAHEVGGDFVIGRVSGAEAAYEAVGIESPGLSAAPAIAEYLGKMIADDYHLTWKKNYVAMPPRKKPFSAMSMEERAAAIAENPLYGKIVCRCEVVTEGEIRDAIRRPVGATTIDGVKRRTRAGMGRCQGGFCSPRVAEILSEELGVPMTDITKDGGESRLLVGTIDAAMKGELAK